jgi:hypothetical protein
MFSAEPVLPPAEPSIDVPSSVRSLRAGATGFELHRMTTPAKD